MSESLIVSLRLVLGRILINPTPEDVWLLQKDLLALKELVEAMNLKPVIERYFALSEVAEALRHVGKGHSRGQTVIRIPG